MRFSVVTIHFRTITIPNAFPLSNSCGLVLRFVVFEDNKLGAPLYFITSYKRHYYVLASTSRAILLIGHFNRRQIFNQTSCINDFTCSK